MTIPNKDTTYSTVPNTRGSRWNWYKSELVTFPDGTRELAHRHPNGGGWVADSASVSLSVYVHSLACVYKGAIVNGDVEMYQYAQIFNGARVFGRVRMSVDESGNPSIGFTKIYGDGFVYGEVTLIAGRNEINLSGGNKVMGAILVKNDSVISPGDTFGNYTTNAGGGFQEPLPQAHANFNPITRGPLSLTVGSSSIGAEDFSDINRLNIRDNKPGSDVVPIITVPASELDFENPIIEESETPASVVDTTTVCKDTDLSRLTFSQTAVNQGIPNNPTPQALENLKVVCSKIVQPMMKRFGRVTINSGYRSAALNAAVGGSNTSQHSLGQAVDIEVPGMSNFDLAKWIDANLDYDQLILENFVKGGDPNSGWVHVSSKSSGNRRQKLTKYAGSNSFIPGLVIR